MQCIAQMCLKEMHCTAAGLYTAWWLQTSTAPIRYFSCLPADTLLPKRAQLTACALQTRSGRGKAHVEALEGRRFEGRWRTDLRPANLLSVVMWHLLRGQQDLLQPAQNRGGGAWLLAAAWPQWRCPKVAARPKLSGCLLELLPRLCVPPIDGADSVAHHL